MPFQCYILATRPQSPTLAVIKLYANPNCWSHENYCFYGFSINGKSSRVVEFYKPNVHRHVFGLSIRSNYPFISPRAGGVACISQCMYARPVHCYYFLLAFHSLVYWLSVFHFISNERCAEDRLHLNAYFLDLFHLGHWLHCPFYSWRVNNDHLPRISAIGDTHFPLLSLMFDSCELHVCLSPIFHSNANFLT